MTLDQLLAQIRYDFDQHTVRVFTIGYEAAEGTDVSKQISEVTRGRYYEGKQTNIREIFKDISTLFLGISGGERLYRVHQDLTVFVLWHVWPKRVRTGGSRERLSVMFVVQRPG